MRSKTPDNGTIDEAPSTSNDKTPKKKSASKKLDLQPKTKSPSPNKAFGKAKKGHNGHWRYCEDHYKRVRNRERKQEARRKKRQQEQKQGNLPRVRCIMLFANNGDRKDDIIAQEWENVLRNGVDIDRLDRWMPTLDTLKAKASSKKKQTMHTWKNWIIGDWTKSQKAKLSPLTSNKGTVRVIAGLPETGNAICELVQAGVNDWKNADKCREFLFINLSGHGGAVGMISALRITIDDREQVITTYCDPEDLIKGVMNGLEKCEKKRTEGFVPIIALDWCNSMQATAHGGDDWWKNLDMDAGKKIEKLYLIGWLSSPSIKEGLQELSWLANFENPLDDDAMRYLVGNHQSPVRLVELRKGKFVSEKLYQ